MDCFSAIYDRYKSSTAYFVIPLFLATIALYFCPTIVYKYINNGYAGLFLTLLYNIQDSHSIYPFSIVAIVAFIMALLCTALSFKKTLFLIGIVPINILGLIDIFENIRLIYYPQSSAISMSVYLVFDILVVLYITFLLFCALVSKISQKERKPHPPRQHKPTKSERIAELERQVAELTKEKDTH